MSLCFLLDCGISLVGVGYLNLEVGGYCVLNKEGFEASVVLLIVGIGARGNGASGYGLILIEAVLIVLYEIIVCFLNSLLGIGANGYVLNDCIVNVGSELFLNFSIVGAFKVLVGYVILVALENLCGALCGSLTLALFSLTDSGDKFCYEIYKLISTLFKTCVTSL